MAQNMNKKLSILLLVTLSAIMVSSCGDDKGDEQIFPRNASLKEAEEVLGIEIPRPHYMPPGYEVEKVILESESRVSLIFSDKNDREIELEIDWRRQAVLPYKIDSDSPTVELDGNIAQLISLDNENIIAWNWIPEQYENSLFIFQLHDTKELAVSELIMIANSVDW